MRSVNNIDLPLLLLFYLPGQQIGSNVHDSEIKMSKSNVLSFTFSGRQKKMHRGAAWQGPDPAHPGQASPGVQARAGARMRHLGSPCAWIHLVSSKIQSEAVKPEQDVTQFN